MPFGEVLKYLAENNIGYSIVDKAQVEKVASAEHNEGVAFVVKKKELTSVDDAIQKGTVSSLGTKDLTQPCLLVSLRPIVPTHKQSYHKNRNLLKIVFFLNWLRVFLYIFIFDLVKFLDNLRNPHNMGSMLRAAAFFGVQTVFAYNDADYPQ